MYLVLWEFAKKQKYIFKSNKLIEAVGASLIMKKLTEDFSAYNLKEENFIIKKGGKALYLFETLEEAKKFNKEFSFKIVKDYPGLEVFIVIKELNEENSDIREDIEETYELLEKKKRERRNSSCQISFGLEKLCVSTGFPASVSLNEDNRKRYYSKESKVKIDFARDNQEDFFQKLIPDGYKLEKDLNNLVNYENAYISIIHIDGNSMGEKFKNLKNKVQRGENEKEIEFDKRYVNILKEFSEKVNGIYEETFQYTMKVIEKNRDKLNKITNIEKGDFPVRPLILAGDDITYIANGYIGIESARIFIEELSKKRLQINDIDLGYLNACAGVAIIKKGYPFIKGYELADDLCRNAKKVLLEKGDKNLTAIDFHIARGEIVGGIDYIRRENYSLKDKEGILTMRPLIVNNEKEWRTYENFIKAYKNIQNAISDKNIGRNKIKALARELKKGERATEHFIKFYSIDIKRNLPLIHGSGDFCFNNEEDGRCTYLDAIEVMDIFVELEE